MKISFVCIRMKTNFHNKNVAHRVHDEVQSNSKMAYLSGLRDRWS